MMASVLEVCWWCAGDAGVLPLQLTVCGQVPSCQPCVALLRVRWQLPCSSQLLLAQGLHLSGMLDSNGCFLLWLHGCSGVVEVVG
jgi:hypothetical protein